MSDWTAIPVRPTRTLDRATSAARLALVVPTLNEAENIAPVLAEARAALDRAAIPCEIIVVDDGSTDGTADRVSAIALGDPRIRLIVRQGERGLAGAILEGWRHTDADFLGVMDGDCQHPPALLPELYRAIAEGADLAIGSRYAPGGVIDDWNLVRRLVSLAAAGLARPLQTWGVRARDPMSGFFLVRRASIHAIAFQQTGFKLLLEILVRGRIRTVEEIPFAFGLRPRGNSKASVKVAWDYARLLVRLYATKLALKRGQPRLGVSYES